MNQLKPLLLGVMGALALGGVLGCATAAPKELVAARTAYEDASKSAAATYTPAELVRAREALDKANQAFDDGREQETQDLAYIALRKAELAKIKGSISQEEDRLKQAKATLQELKANELSSTRARLTKSEQELAKTGEQLEAERQGREEAEKRAAEAFQKLENVASVKQDERGTVITLSGSVLFASGKSELLPSAQLKLNEVADALKSSTTGIVIEGHTDSKGSEGFNQELATRRAQSVRDYLLSRGVADEVATAVGIGESRPVADNNTAEGRANNRRVEIVVRRQDSERPTQGVGGSGEREGGNPEAVPSTPDQGR